MKIAKLKTSKTRATIKALRGSREGTPMNHPIPIPIPRVIMGMSQFINIYLTFNSCCWPSNGILPYLVINWPAGWLWFPLFIYFFFWQGGVYVMLRAIGPGKIAHTRHLLNHMFYYCYYAVLLVRACIVAQKTDVDDGSSLGLYIKLQ